ncbi:MAG TPA: hypothetical protein VJ697_13410 [Nitrososphaeraceae archaeon]|nr:hypothetical protein [Nitrososphaeraceae archaeon]
MSNDAKNSETLAQTSNLENKNDSIEKTKDSEKTKESNGTLKNQIVNKIVELAGLNGIEDSYDRSSNLKFITFGLFALIGFIVIIYALLVAVVSDTIIQSANVFFVVTIISISTLVGTLLYQIQPMK